MYTPRQQISGNSQTPKPVTLAQACRYWLKPGFISFVGGWSHAVCIALLRFRAGIIPMIAECAGAGLIYRLMA